MKLEKITVGTYTNRKLKSTLKFPIQKICKKCKTIYDCNSKKDIKSLLKCSKCKNDLSYVDENSLYYTSEVIKAVLSLGKDLNGKRQTKTFTGKTQEKALRKLYAFKDTLEKTEGPIVLNKATNCSISDIIKHLKKEALQMGRINKNTFKTNMDALKRMQKEKFVNKSITKVSRADLLSYFESIRHYSESTIKKQYEIISQAFAYAFYQKIITINFFEGYNKIAMPSSEAGSEPITALTIEEEKKLISYLANTPDSTCKHKYLFLLQLTTGMRIGECLTLSTDDVDMENGKLSIKRTLTKDTEGNTIIGTTAKTYSGKRTLNLNTMSRMALEGALKNYHHNEESLLFCKDDGSLYDEGSINSALKRICIKCGIRVRNYISKSGKDETTSDVHSHMLRHTFATRCFELNVNIKTVQYLLGHSSAETTMDIYTHISTEQVKKEIQAINTLDLTPIIKMA